MDLRHGDCLEVLRTLPDNSVDSLVTDPPAFIDFMGKQWDGTDHLWKYLWSNASYVKSVATALRKLRVGNVTGEGSTAHGAARTPTSANSVQSISNARSAGPLFEFIDARTKGSVPLLVLTAREVLDLLSGSSCDRTLLEAELENGGIEGASFAIPLLLPEIATTSTVPRSVITSIKRSCSPALGIQATSTDVARISVVIEVLTGRALEKRPLNEIGGHASTAENPTLVERFNAITLSPGASREITASLTLLLCALAATEKSKNIPSYLASNFMESVMRECLRVLKPGAHGLVWALPRTSHWTATALEDAGFEIRDCVYHLFGSGFPKSLDVSKAIDKAAGAERASIGEQKITGNSAHRENFGHADRSEGKGMGFKPGTIPITTPATDAAKQWQGFGTALKPAVECWWLVRKPCSEKTVSANVLKWGTGALNIDGSRIKIDPKDPNQRPNGSKPLSEGGETSMFKMGGRNPAYGGNSLAMDLGRFPSHLILDEETSAMLDAQSGERPSRGTYKNPGKEHKPGPNTATFKFGGLDCDNKYANEKGGASRFFYCAKISSSERNAGLDGMEKKNSRVIGRKKLECLDCGCTRIDSGGLTCGHTNSHWVNSSDSKGANNHGGGSANTHPTVKPQKLMRYLAKLVTPPGGVVLDPFMGSGSTGLAAKSEGFGFVGIEREAEYFEIARVRVGSGTS